MKNQDSFSSRKASVVAAAARTDWVSEQSPVPDTVQALTELPVRTDKYMFSVNLSLHRLLRDNERHCRVSQEQG